MRASLNALTDELKRLKASGVKSVVVSEEGLAQLHKVVSARAQAKVLPANPTPEPVVPKSASGAQKLPPKNETASNNQTPQAKITVKPLAPARSSNFPPPPKVTLPAGDKQTRWDALFQMVINDPVCKAHVRPGKKLVLGIGNLNARIFFCGEAPGAEEEEQGEPFVGPAGQLLTRMILGMGLKRSDAEELAYCLPYLKAQIDVVNPEIIVALGSTAVQGLFGAGSFKTLGEVRSQWKLFAEKPVMVTYHPSYILRNPTNRSKRAIWEDLLKVMERASLPITDKQQNFFLEK